MHDNTREILLNAYISERDMLPTGSPEQSIFDFMYLNGARVGEALKVRPQDIDFDKGVAHIQTEKSKDIHRTTIFTPKDPNLIQSIKRACDGKQANELLWPFNHRKQPRIYVWELAQKAFKCTVHSFRHTHAIFCVRELNMTVPELMAEMGWVRWDTAKHYVKYQSLEARMKKVNDYETRRNDL